MRLVEIDDSLLERATSACGERTIKATVEAGLQALADRAVGADHARLLRSTDFDLEAFERAREPRSAAITVLDHGGAVRVPFASPSLGLVIPCGERCL